MRNVRWEIEDDERKEEIIIRIRRSYRRGRVGGRTPLPPVGYD